MSKEEIKIFNKYLESIEHEFRYEDMAEEDCKDELEIIKFTRKEIFERIEKEIDDLFIKFSRRLVTEKDEEFEKFLIEIIEELKKKLLYPKGHEGGEDE